jgi:hypothetical protein
MARDAVDASRARSQAGFGVAWMDLLGPKIYAPQEAVCVMAGVRGARSVRAPTPFAAFGGLASGGLAIEGAGGMYTQAVLSRSAIRDVEPLAGQVR